VIQALAERAATDANLKDLMRIVAAGKANQDELRKFQAHIDDLNKLLNIKPTPRPPPAPAHHSTTSSPYGPPNSIYRQPPASHPPPIKQDYYMTPQPQALRSKGPVAPPRPDISAILFEFAGGSGDRFLFPKFSILEYRPGAQGYKSTQEGPSIIASFLIARKGSQSDSSLYDPKLDYYQPVTIRVMTAQPKHLDGLWKVVAPQDEVRRYMDSVMDNMTRAEYLLLAMRLPREVEKIATPEVETKEETEEEVLWGATKSMPLVKKPVKIGLTEEQEYQNFIASVS
jgi:hypothetical protein